MSELRFREHSSNIILDVTVYKHSGYFCTRPWSGLWYTVYGLYLKDKVDEISLYHGSPSDPMRPCESSSVSRQRL